MLLSELKISYYREPDSHISNKAKVGLELSNYATKQLEDATCVDISNLGGKRDFIALKAEVEDLDISKFLNVLSGLNDLKTRVDDLY